MNSYMTPGTTAFGAHEFIGMNEALMAKSAKIEMLSYLSHQVTDERLRSMFQRQAQAVADHYHRGISLLRGQGAQGEPLRGTPQRTPRVGLQNPQFPAPNMNAQPPSERAIMTTVLNLHKFHGVAWYQFALECTHPQLRTYLVDGALMCDSMAYELFTLMNEKGYYQVPEMDQQVAQTLTNAYSQPTGMPVSTMIQMQ